MSTPSDFLLKLDSLLKERFEKRPEKAYTTTLYNAGLDRILRKIGEESGELIIASKNQDLDEIKNEASDLLFHMMVLLQAHGLSITDIIDLLERRHANKSRR